MPYTTVVAGTTITASWANASVRDQTVTPFATTAARDAAITVPVAGMLCVTTDTNTLWQYVSGAWVAITQPGAWTSWTPTITQSAAVTVTIAHAVYARLGRMIVAHYRMTVTGAGVAANPIVMAGLPAVAARSVMLVGSGSVYDSSAGTNYSSRVDFASTTTVEFRAHGTVAAADNRLGASQFTAALAAGDILDGFLIYEAAS